MAVDDTAIFRAVFRGPYKTLEDFEAQLKEFQLQTATCFYRYDVLTASAYQKKTGQVVPDGFRYKWLQYRCVHCNRRGKGGKRYAKLGCEASIAIRVKDSSYEIGKYNVVHNHNFHIGNPSLYVGNRRLSPEAERDVFELMHSFENIRGLQCYVHERYHKRLSRHDIRSIRTRLSGVPRANDVDVVPELLQGNGDERVRRENCEVRERSPLTPPAQHLSLPTVSTAFRTLTREDKLSRTKRLLDDLLTHMVSLETNAFLQVESFLKSYLQQLVNSNRPVSHSDYHMNVREFPAPPVTERQKTKRKQSLSPRIHESALPSTSHSPTFRRPNTASLAYRTKTKGSSIDT